MARWSSVPTWWIREMGISVFIGGKQTGTSIAALKILLAVVLLADFHTRKTSSSLSDLEGLTGLSRPKVIDGINDLEQKRILIVNRDGHVNEYELVMPEDDKQWGKIPYQNLRRYLAEISNRGIMTLAGMKIYLLLVAWRPNDSSSISISHEKIREQTGVQPRHVRGGIDVLINHRLIRVSTNEARTPNKIQAGYNVYTLLGLNL